MSELIQTTRQHLELNETVRMAGTARLSVDPSLLESMAVQGKAPLFGVVSRLTSQKGIDLVLGALDAVLAEGGQLVVLGQGEAALQQALTGARVELHLPDAIGHVEVGELGWSNIAPLWRAIDSLLALRD